MVLKLFNIHTEIYMKIINQVTTILLFSSAIVLTGCSSDTASPPAAPIGDISGTWYITDASVSQTAGCSEVSNYNLYVTQNNNSITVVDTAANNFSGVLSGNKLTWSGSYPDGYGTTTANVTATIAANCMSLTATSTWSYSETGFACSGTSTATGTRTSGGTGC